MTNKNYLYEFYCVRTFFEGKISKKNWRLGHDVLKIAVTTSLARQRHFSRQRRHPTAHVVFTHVLDLNLSIDDRSSTRRKRKVESHQLDSETQQMHSVTYIVNIFILNYFVKYYNV
jgi:hypothetical protein